MAILPLVIAPDDRLTTRADEVKLEDINDDTRKILDDMVATMYHNEGIGLAAVQVGVMKRMLVLDVAQKNNRNEPMKFINPEIIWSSEEQSPYDEGCLSFPEQIATIYRPAEIKIEYYDENASKQQLHADGLLATCLQHEIDHLDGICFVDHLSRLKKDMIIRKVGKLKKHHMDN